MTLHSMTGYARIEGQDEDAAWSWEARSVNGRGLEIRTRLPTGLDGLDPAIRDLVQKRFKRGNVSLNLALKSQAAAGLPVVNEAVLARYVALAEHWQVRAPQLKPASIDGLMSLKGVIESAEPAELPDLAEKRQSQLLADLGRALDGLAAMRRAEGARLLELLSGQLAEMEARLNEALALSAVDPAAIAGRLKQQIQELLGAVPSLSEDRLAQEAALLAAKADVREELDRLRAHIAAARDMLVSGEAVGRKLDFLSQEFNREANTLCSKSSDIAMTRTGLALKAVIEQFREQVQNVE